MFATLAGEKTSTNIKENFKKEERKEESREKKALKQVATAKSITLDVEPWDNEVDLNEVERLVREHQERWFSLGII